jgi:hypothetical protein
MIAGPEEMTPAPQTEEKGALVKAISPFDFITAFSEIDCLLFRHVTVSECPGKSPCGRDREKHFR